MTKQRFVSKQGHRQPHIHSKARERGPQLLNGLLSLTNDLDIERKILSKPHKLWRELL